MPSIYTLGGSNRRTEFSYTGDVQNGVTINFTGNPRISPNFFQSILEHFNGLSIRGGFSMTDPTDGGFGQWVENNSVQLNPIKLTPRHASFIAAILEHEGYITSSLDGNAVILHF
jgi:hypothetical protein